MDNHDERLIKEVRKYNYLYDALDMFWKTNTPAGPIEEVLVTMSRSSRIGSPYALVGNFCASLEIPDRPCRSIPAKLVCNQTQATFDVCDCRSIIRPLEVPLSKYLPVRRQCWHQQQAQVSEGHLSDCGLWDRTG